MWRVIVRFDFESAHLAHYPETHSQSKYIQTPSTCLNLSQFFRYSLENGNKI